MGQAATAPAPARRENHESHVPRWKCGWSEPSVGIARSDLGSKFRTGGNSNPEPCCCIDATITYATPEFAVVSRVTANKIMTAFYNRCEAHDGAGRIATVARLAACVTDRPIASDRPTDRPRPTPPLLPVRSSRQWRTTYNAPNDDNAATAVHIAGFSSRCCCCPRWPSLQVQRRRSRHTVRTDRHILQVPSDNDLNKWAAASVRVKTWMRWRCLPAVEPVTVIE